MQLKTNLHFHTADDPRHKHSIKYTFEEGVDYAASLGFDVIALTCHRTAVIKPHYKSYAASKNILFIPGIELNIDERRNMRGKHLIVLNCRENIEEIKTFSELENYKKTYPEIFVLAPHPYFYGNYSLKGYLEKYIHLVDGIEHSWFYSKLFNRNKKAKDIAIKYNLPLIATSDAHFLNNMNKDYTLVDAVQKTPEAIFEALKQKKFKNITSPKEFLKEMACRQGLFFAKDFFGQYR